MRLVGLVVLLLGPARASFIVSEGNCWVNASCVHSPNWPQNYDHDVECTFRPATSGWLDVASFHIEAHHSCFWDHVTVQGTQYCDDIGPQGVAVTPNTTMSFVSDYSVAHEGFQICLGSTFTGTVPPPTFSPTISVSCGEATAFNVTSGGCRACGNCFSSPNYHAGQEYDNDHECTIAPLQSGWLDVVEFDVEYQASCGWDSLVVDGTSYCGDVGPQGLHVDSSSSITFSSDYIIAADGFHICLSSAFIDTLPPPTASPTVPCDEATAFNVTSGGCHACGSCFSSPNYLAGQDYDDNHACTIAPLQSGWLDVVDFDVEDSAWWTHCMYDGLIVDGVTYCGTVGPQGSYITTSSTISFFSDQTVTEDGFHICLSDTFVGPSVSPTTAAPTFAPTSCDTATGFAVVSGDCMACGNCFHTPNYLSGDGYDHNHDCEITPLSDGWLDVVEFDVEYHGACAYDGLIVDDMTYCGDAGPVGAYVTSSSVISFYSDHSVTDDGVYICLSDTFTSTLPPPTASPTMTVAPSSRGTTVSTTGGCTAVDECFYSHDYPSDYGNYGYCEFTALVEGALSVVDFHIESHRNCNYDWFLVNGTKFCGESGPANMSVSAGDVMVFHSDHSVTRGGFALCLTANDLAAPSPAPTLEAPAPTQAPTRRPTTVPTPLAPSPTQAPTRGPTQAPVHASTQAPAHGPTQAPTHAPIQAPVHAPTQAPTARPTDAPIPSPTPRPTFTPTPAPTSEPCRNGQYDSGVETDVGALNRPSRPTPTVSLSLALPWTGCE